MAENSSSCKDLLQLERNSAAASSAAFLESKLIVCKEDGRSNCQSRAPTQKPVMVPTPASGVLGKVKDFLGVISESNKKLLHDAKENPQNYDIEVLSGKESELIEMDLMLGIADLLTPEAVAAAESAMAGNQPAIHASESSSELDSEGSSLSDSKNSSLSDSKDSSIISDSKDNSSSGSDSEDSSSSGSDSEDSSSSGSDSATGLDSEDSSDEEEDDNHNNNNHNNKESKRFSKLNSNALQLRSKDIEKDHSGVKPDEQKPKKRPKIVELS